MSCFCSLGPGHVSAIALKQKYTGRPNYRAADVNEVSCVAILVSARGFLSYCQQGSRTLDSSTKKKIKLNKINQCFAINYHDYQKLNIKECEITLIYFVNTSILLIYCTMGGWSL